MTSSSSSFLDSVSRLAITPAQRLYLVWAFVANGILISVQLSQSQSPTPLTWARLTAETRPYWYTVYMLQAFLFIQNMYPILLKNMTGYFQGREETVLNAVWVGLLGLEILMVLGVAVRSVVKTLKAPPRPKQKTT
jgi:hypothetical protein